MPQYGNMDKAFLGMKADNNVVTRVESWAATEDVEFGYPVFSYLGEERKAYKFYEDVTKLVFDADLITGNLVDLTVNSTPITQVPFNTDHDTTMTDLVNSITAVTGIDAALATSTADPNNRTVFIRSKAVTNAVTGEAVTGGASQAGITKTTQSDQVFIGVAIQTAKNVEVSNQGKYYKDQTISVANRGIFWSILDGTANNLDDAFLSVSGASAGKFSSTPGADVSCKFKSNNYTNLTTTDVMASVEISGAKKLFEEITWV